MNRSPIPVRPDYSAARRSQGQSLTRAVFAVAKASRLGDPVAIAKSSWPEDRGVLSLLTRADATPASLAVAGWAGSLSGVAVGEFIASLGPLSAAAKLIAAGQRLTLDGVQTVLIPKAGDPALDADWVAPGGQIGAYQGDLDTEQLGPPKKLAALVVCTSELPAYANGEQVLARMVSERIGRKLDSSMFDSNAADGTRPSGLLNGVTPIDASVEASPVDAMIEDLGNLAGAVVDLGGNAENIAFIMSGRQAVFARLNLLTNENVTIWPSTGLADGDVVAIQTDSFVSAFSSEPTITLARDAALVMTNSPAQELVAATGGVAVMGDPARSLWATDCVGVRVTLPCAWCLRAPLIATISGVTWGTAPA